MLYSALEDYKIDILIGEGPSAKILNISLPKFTLIGATTRIGLISKPLRDRFGIIFNMGFYTIDELKPIVMRTAGIFDFSCDVDAAEEIAMRARGTPRIAVKLLRRIRDFMSIKKLNFLTKAEVLKIFIAISIDKFGLEEEDRRYLKFIAVNYSSLPVGIETISAALSMERDTIEDYIEPYLISIGMVQRTSRGRILTENALNYALNLI